MEFNCHLCPRRFIFHYAYYQHLHIEHRHYVCEICNAYLPSLRSFKHHAKIHIKREYDLCQDRWEFETEFEKKVEQECWVKTMVLDSACEIKKIQKSLEDILIMERRDARGDIYESTSPLFIQINDLISRLDYEEKYLKYFANIDGTVTKFAEGLKINKPPKFRPALPLRSDWKQ